MERIFVVVLLCIVLQVNAADRKIIVDSKYGKLEGNVVTSKSGFQIDTFLGIQYGKAPERFSVLHNGILLLLPKKLLYFIVFKLLTFI